MGIKFCKDLQLDQFQEVTKTFFFFFLSHPEWNMNAVKQCSTKQQIRKTHVVNILYLGQMDVCVKCGANPFPAMLIRNDHTVWNVILFIYLFFSPDSSA